MIEKKPNKKYNVKGIWIGLGICLLLHLVVSLLFFIVGIPTFFFIGIVQLIYIIPAIIIARKCVGIVQGLLIGAGITFLLNAACFGIVLASFSS